MGSEETHPTSSVHEKIPTTSADEPAAADPQTAPVEEQEIPQPEEQSQSQRISSQANRSSRLKISLPSMYSSLIIIHMILLA